MMKQFAVLLAILLLLPALTLGAGGDEAKTAMDQAKSDITALADKGISTFAVADLLKEAELRYSNGDYAAATEVAKEISAMKSSALHADALINEIEPLITELESGGTDVTAIKKSFSDTTDAFSREDFKGAETHAAATLDLVEAAQSAAGLQKTLISAEGLNLIKFITEHWAELIAACAVAAVIIKYGWKEYSRKSAKRKTALLKRKKENLLKLMKEAQRKHFIEGETSRNEYTTAMRSYREQMAEANKEIQMLKQRKGGKLAKNF